MKTTDPVKRALMLDDSGSKRLAFPAILGGVPLGHYKLSSVERYPNLRKSKGPGSVFIADLKPADIREVFDRIEPGLDDDTFRINDYFGRVGMLGGDETAAIHGGGEALSDALAATNFQPLTKPWHGVRLYNSDLTQLMNYLEPRLRCLQLAILTIS